MRPRLYRSRTDYWIAGVCGGLGRYFGVDSNPIRLGFVILAAWNGLGVLLYLVTVLIVPEEPLGETPAGAPVAPPAPPAAPG
ncbi:MAG TPA: PspC domain-containing protein, partial [bacterium]|nr:PspC domain-containing protein [bacterium]